MAWLATIVLWISSRTTLDFVVRTLDLVVRFVPFVDYLPCAGHAACQLFVRAASPRTSPLDAFSISELKGLTLICVGFMETYQKT